MYLGTPGLRASLRQHGSATPLHAGMRACRWEREAFFDGQMPPVLPQAAAWMCKPGEGQGRMGWGPSPISRDPGWSSSGPSILNMAFPTHWGNTHCDLRLLVYLYASLIRLPARDHSVSVMSKRGIEVTPVS